MGWYYTLTLTCKILPECIDFIKNEYLQIFADDEDFSQDNNKTRKVYDSLSKSYRDLIDCWTALHIGHRFREYKLDTDGTFFCEIAKKVTSHSGDLKED